MVPCSLSCFDIFFHFLFSNKAEDEEAEQEEYQQNAELLYGLIHSRYIITMHGMETMVSTVGPCEAGVGISLDATDANFLPFPHHPNSAKNTKGKILESVQELCARDKPYYR